LYGTHMADEALSSVSYSTACRFVGGDEQISAGNTLRRFSRKP